MDKSSLRSVAWLAALRLVLAGLVHGDRESRPRNRNRGPAGARPRRPTDVGPQPSRAADCTDELPYVYTKWRHFTDRRRPAQRSHLRRQSARLESLDRDRGRLGLLRQRNRQDADLEGKGRPAVPSR